MALEIPERAVSETSAFVAPCLSQRFPEPVANSGASGGRTARFSRAARHSR
ncbi:hypothetical protein [Amycolatopsis sp. cmx-4-54]|uniref:hypothetical protein n=1 Tax=Amycolatopsis sp. cmx-4-54 TaxID=2790936 RepID=UPI003979381D